MISLGRSAEPHTALVLGRSPKEAARQVREIAQHQKRLGDLAARDREAGFLLIAPAAHPHYAVVATREGKAELTEGEFRACVCDSATEAMIRLAERVRSQKTTPKASPLLDLALPWSDGAAA